MSIAFLLLVACSLSTMVVLAQDCFNSTFKIIEAQLQNPMPEYIVCPNSTITVGVPDAALSAFVDGDWPLVPLGPNVTFKCGADGKSSNNCVLVGSFIHFLSLPNLPQVGKVDIVTDNLYVSGFTLTGDGSPKLDLFGGLFGVSIAVNAPGANQVFNDITWTDAKFHTFFLAEEIALVPDEGLPNLSIEATLQNSEFRDVLYSRRLIGVTKQNLTIRNTRFVNVDVFNQSDDCSCPHQPITGNTGVGTGVYTSTSDTYITLANNCFESITSTSALLETVTNDTTSVVIGNENNVVTGWTILEESTSEKDVCTGGIGISTAVNGEFEECESFASASMCLLDDMVAGSRSSSSISSSSKGKGSKKGTMKSMKGKKGGKGMGMLGGGKRRGKGSGQRMNVYIRNQWLHNR